MPKKVKEIPVTDTYASELRSNGLTLDHEFVVEQGPHNVKQVCLPGKRPVTIRHQGVEIGDTIRFAYEAVLKGRKK
ncbi:hypothetical protein JXD20_00430 [Candidatus Peregrinibacteria bacterium]|nr:hypothetical protein [Candidatus Peregrinibacteria bacterium]